MAKNKKKPSVKTKEDKAYNGYVRRFTEVQLMNIIAVSNKYILYKKYWDYSGEVVRKWTEVSSILDKMEESFIKIRSSAFKPTSGILSKDTLDVIKQISHCSRLPISINKKRVRRRKMAAILMWSRWAILLKNMNRDYHRSALSFSRNINDQFISLVYGNPLVKE